jgi:hypothetical protein
MDNRHAHALCRFRWLPENPSPLSKVSSADSSHPIQKAWIEVDVPQCGYCQSGQIMSAAALLAKSRTPPIPTSMKPCAAISAAGTYQEIREAIHRAARNHAAAGPRHLFFRLLTKEVRNEHSGGEARPAKFLKGSAIVAEALYWASTCRMRTRRTRSRLRHRPQ